MLWCLRLREAAFIEWDAGEEKQSEMPVRPGESDWFTFISLHDGECKMSQVKRLRGNRNS